MLTVGNYKIQILPEWRCQLRQINLQTLCLLKVISLLSAHSLAADNGEETMKISAKDSMIVSKSGYPVNVEIIFNINVTQNLNL